MKNKRWLGNIKNPFLRIPLVLLIFFVVLPLFILLGAVFAVCWTTFNFSFWWVRFKEKMQTFLVFGSLSEGWKLMKKALNGSVNDKTSDN